MAKEILHTKEEEKDLYRTCKRCGTTKSVTEYHFSNKKRGIRKSYCKDCSCAITADHKKEHKEKYHDYCKKYYQNNKDKWKEGYNKR